MIYSDKSWNLIISFMFSSFKLIIQEYGNEVEYILAWGIIQLILGQNRSGKKFKKINMYQSSKYGKS